ncbi:Chromate resistance protein ChrB [Amycolatopsis plumensis]|uniref:Chromate resistance protein ChrB n=1 Tax=Amycolatopsis plumensis TaxID=236508 RepID=A0ABV5UBR0_9PSEU
MRAQPGEWVLLSYRIPREPSTPRIAVWRKLKRLGVAQLGDGLVALPADARTREHLDWIAEDIVDAGGSAMVWLAHPAAVGQEREVVQAMADARTAEYTAVLAEAEQATAAAEPERLRIMRKLRAELRRIHRRDYFPPPQRAAAERAVTALHPDHASEETA